MPVLEILSSFGGEVVAAREPEIGEVVRAGGSEYYWTAPMAAAGQPKPQDQTAGQVLDLMVAGVGVAVTASCWRSDADEAVVWRGRMQLSAGRGISKARAAIGFQALVSAGLLTAGQRAAILVAWPLSN